MSNRISEIADSFVAGIEPHLNGFNSFALSSEVGSWMDEGDFTYIGEEPALLWDFIFCRLGVCIVRPDIFNEVLFSIFGYSLTGESANLVCWLGWKARKGEVGQ